MVNSCCHEQVTDCLFLMQKSRRDLRKVSKIEKKGWPQSRESRGIIGETETMKMASRRDQSRGLESRLQALVTM